MNRKFKKKAIKPRIARLVHIPITTSLRSCRTEGLLLNFGSGDRNLRKIKQNL